MPGRVADSRDAVAAVTPEDPDSGGTVHPGADNAATDAPQASHRRDLALGALAFLVALALCVAGYLAIAVPAAWFPGVPAKSWTPANFVLTAGTGRVEGTEFLLTAPDASGAAIVTVATDLRARDYGGVQWIAIEVPATADVRLLWRNDYAPTKLNAVPLKVEAGRLLPVVLADHPDWIGRVTGLALAMRAPLAQPVRMRGVVVKPMGAAEMLGDRLREWTAFEGWTGSSINAVVGGADVQDLPLAPLLALAVAVASAALLAARRWLPRAYSLPIAASLAAMFCAAWFLLDARWAWNLARQVRSTSELYAGKDWRDKHLAAPDAALFAFVERARRLLPATPARVFVLADAHYFRGRAAYHLYPHNVHFEPYFNVLPAADRIRPGDWIVVYQRRGVQYDPSQRNLRWESGTPIPVDLRLIEPGAAVFLAR